MALLHRCVLTAHSFLNETPRTLLRRFIMPSYTTSTDGPIARLYRCKHLYIVNKMFLFLPISEKLHISVTLMKCVHMFSKM